MSPELIIALDLLSSGSIGKLVDSLPSEIACYKLGLELFSSEGPQALQPLRACKKRVFLDLKLHDIPRTVARAVAAVASHEVDLLTIHACGGEAMMRAAAEAAGNTRLLAVTVLTSLDQADLRQLGVNRSPAEHALALGKMAIDCGIDGLVCSPLEAALFRKSLGSLPLIVTPGVRMAGDAPGDQKRVSTPRAAVEAGANMIVVGRPILEAPSPRAAAEQFLLELSQSTSLQE